MHNKIFAIEGEWDHSLKSTTSIIAPLKFLKTLEEINFIYRRVCTREEFEYYLNRSITYKSYSILYFAFHGSKDTIYLNDDLKSDDNTIIDLEDLMNMDSKIFEDRIVHFGACETAFNKHKLIEFKEKTGAAQVSGFTKAINFLEGTIVDLLYFKQCSRYKRSFTKDTKLDDSYVDLAGKLGFVVV